MSLVNCYVALADVKSAVNQTTDADDESIEASITAACRAIDAYCGQFFYDTGTASARTFRIVDDYYATIDPFHTTTGLVIKTDSAGDGTYATTWAATDYELDRFGGIMADLLGAPYDTLHSGVGNYTFGSYTLTRRQYPLQVTARWGWAAVPPQIQQAALLVSADLWKRRDAPFGITTTDFGPLRVSSDAVRSLAGLVGHFRRYDRVAGIA